MASVVPPPRPDIFATHKEVAPDIWEAVAKGRPVEVARCAIAISIYFGTGAPLH